MAKRALELARDDFNRKFNGDYTKKLIQVNYEYVSKAFNDLYNTKSC